MEDFTVMRMLRQLQMVSKKFSALFYSLHFFDSFSFSAFARSESVSSKLKGSKGALNSSKIEREITF
jgi:hypothetical protein